VRAITSVLARSSGRLWLIFAGVFAVAAALTIIGTLLAGDKRSDVAFEAAKSGIQLGVVGLLTTAVAQAVKRFNDERDARAKREAEERERRNLRADAQREEQARLNEYRLTVFRDAVNAYNQIKTVRRALRAAGLSPPSSGSLESWQRVEFDTQMRALNDAELALEKIGHEVAARRDLFPNVDKEEDALTKSQEYIRKVLNAWEKRALSGTDLDHSQEKALNRLHDFLAKRKERNVTDFWPYFNSFESAIRADMTAAASDGSEPDPGRPDEGADATKRDSIL
jgi:hypothetical protein